MKIYCLLLLLVLIYSCQVDQKPKNIKGDLNYSPVVEKSDFLSAELFLSANIKKQEMPAEITLANRSSKPVVIQEITIFTPGGLRSFPENGKIKPISIAPGKDTLITVKFSAVKDVKVYELTGKPGYFKPEYMVSVFYKVQGDPNLYTINLNTILPKSDYQAYINKYTRPITGYSFNTETNFDQTEGAYLATLKLNDRPFAFVAQQELALTGLNIWMNCLYERDSLRAELLIVNHSDYTVKLIADSINLANEADRSQEHQKIVVLEKITGSQKDKNVMEKGDKVLIHFKAYFKNPGKRLILSLKHALELNGSKPLFSSDIELLQVNLPIPEPVLPK